MGWGLGSSGGGRDGIEVMDSSVQRGELGPRLSPSGSPWLQGHTDELWGLATHPSRSLFLTCGHDRQVCMWDSGEHTAAWSLTLEVPPWGEWGGGSRQPGASPCRYHPVGDGERSGLEPPPGVTTLVGMGDAMGWSLTLEVLPEEVGWGGVGGRRVKVLTGCLSPPGDRALR